MQGIGTHCVGASWVMHRLCWLCIFDFGLVRAFPNLGPSCWTNCLVLYAFAHKKRLLGTKHSRWKILALSFYPPAILVCWHTGKSTCSPGSGEQEVNGPKERQNWERCWSNTFPHTSQAQRSFLCLGCPVLVHWLHWLFVQPGSLTFLPFLKELIQNHSVCIASGPVFI